MTDTPGWASPGSSEPPRDGVRPTADAPATVPGPSAPPQTTPQAPGWNAQHGQQAPYGRPGWGQPGGHGPYGQEQHSPRPGVIPLRPLGVGELLDGAVTTVRRHWRTTLSLALGIAVIEQAGRVGVRLLIDGKTGSGTQMAQFAASIPLAVLLNALATALLTIVVSRAVLGRPVTVGDAWREARPRLPQLIGVTLLTTLMSGGVLVLGFLPLALYEGSGGVTALLFLLGLASAPVALWLWVRYSLAAPALMLEKQGVSAALSRSARLVRGSWWRVLGISLLAYVMSLVFAMIIAMPFTVAGMALGFLDLHRQMSFDGTVNQSTAVLVISAISGIISSTLTIPFLGTLGVLIYVDQRIRREALDIELARAAGLPEYGGTGWGDQPPTGV
ncbi:hypothetical protein [Streptomyces sp. NRRL WC-3742]|uniref:hypothetical protein n=1 Tax=Streptomyces sp. NRRL WC-3742 TaxID=1463934 RepID=UPI0004CB2F5F|nr:hypothetical protein [Streptomyces sp. NRRL WC-3742]